MTPEQTKAFLDKADQIRATQKTAREFEEAVQQLVWLHDQAEKRMVYPYRIKLEVKYLFSATDERAISVELGTHGPAVVAILAEILRSRVTDDRYQVQRFQLRDLDHA